MGYLASPKPTHPLKICLSKRKLVFQPSFFRSYVSLDAAFFLVVHRGPRSDEFGEISMEKKPWGHAKDGDGTLYTPEN